MTGTRIARDAIFGGRVPLNKRYDELTPEQKAIVHAPYETMGPGDEPPFPAEGLGVIYGHLLRLQKHLLADGKVVMLVKVGVDGRAKGVDVYESPSVEVSRLYARLLTLIRYKPALCRGVPCEDAFLG